MTAMKVKWQKCGEPGSCGQWHTPPANEGGTVLVSFAYGDDGVIFRRTWDQTTGKRTYAKRLLAEGEVFEPWAHPVN